MDSCPIISIVNQLQKLTNELCSFFFTNENCESANSASRKIVQALEKNPIIIHYDTESKTFKTGSSIMNKLTLEVQDTCARRNLDERLKEMMISRRNKQRKKSFSFSQLSDMSKAVRDTSFGDKNSMSGFSFEESTTEIGAAEYSERNLNFIKAGDSAENDRSTDSPFTNEREKFERIIWNLVAKTGGEFTIEQLRKYIDKPLLKKLYSDFQANRDCLVIEEKTALNKLDNEIDFALDYFAQILEYCDQNENCFNLKANGLEEQKLLNQTLKEKAGTASHYLKNCDNMLRFIKDSVVNLLHIQNRIETSEKEFFLCREPFFPLDH